MYLTHSYINIGKENTYIIAAFGASAVLHLSSDSKLKISFRKLLFASIVTAILGIFISQLTIPLAIKIIITISFSILVMNLTNTSYPPAGAIALIPLFATNIVEQLGYLYALYPVTSGLTIIYLFSLLKEKVLWQVNKL